MLGNVSGSEPSCDYGTPLNDAVGNAGAFASSVSTCWCDDYAAATPWTPEIVEFTLGDLTYLYDLAPLGFDEPRDSDSRVVGALGIASLPSAPRDHVRQAGFVPDPDRWSIAGYDRGHFIAHILGGGLDVNVFPQARDLNRGWSPAGRRWRARERRAARHRGFVLVRPFYGASRTWVPTHVELGVLIDGQLEIEVFDNRPTSP
jgi:hypothetical protein